MDTLYTLLIYFNIHLTKEAKDPPHKKELNIVKKCDLTNEISD